jgi:glycerol-3-phosphate cytidylyltransferase
MILGYTTGVFDLFHVGHLNLLRGARALCDKLIVGVSTDELVAYKHKRPVIPFVERVEIVRSNRFVDVAIAQTDQDKLEAWKRLHYDLLFVGDDWYQSPSWQEYEERLREVGVRVIFLPYTKGTSSTLINEVLDNLRSR